MKNKSLYNEIMEYLEQYHEDIKTDKHYDGNVLKDIRGGASYALANVIGHIKAMKGLRDFESKKLIKKKKK